MKKTTLILFALIGLFLCSCTSEVSEPIQSESQDGDMKITVQGNRSSSFDPFHVDVMVDIHDKKIESFIEVYADNITSENVTFNWSDNRHCVVSFTQRDNTNVSIPVSIEE